MTDGMCVGAPVCVVLRYSPVWESGSVGGAHPGMPENHIRSLKQGDSYSVLSILVEERLDDGRVLFFVVGSNSE